MFKNGEQDLEPYADFVKRIQGVVEEVIYDPTAVDLDAFARQLNFKQPDLKEMQEQEQVPEEEIPISSVKMFNRTSLINENRDKSEMSNYSGRRGAS